MSLSLQHDALQIGDTVELASGGPTFTVTAVHEDDSVSLTWSSRIKTKCLRRAQREWNAVYDPARVCPCELE